MSEHGALREQGVLRDPRRARSSSARERARRRRVHSRRSFEWAWVVVSVALLGTVVVVSMMASLLLRVTRNRPEALPTAAAVAMAPAAENSGFATGDTGSGDQVILSDGRVFERVPWNGVSRFTVLVMGLDRRPEETGLAHRTDTLMLASIDPQGNSIGILSIPRDLYVEVPGIQYRQRVNTPMLIGELRQPGLGPQLAMQTVEFNLGMRVHDYLAVDFNSFVRLVNAIGGIEIDVPESIRDPFYPDMDFGYNPFYISAGLQVLNGETALKYARTRHGDNDFARAERQQAVMYAIRDKLLDPAHLPELIIQSPGLWAALQDGFYTNLNLEQALQLALYLKDIPGSNVRTGVIDDQYAMDYTTPEGAQVLIPDSARLGELMTRVFGANYGI